MDCGQLGERVRLVSDYAGYKCGCYNQTFFPSVLGGPIPLPEQQARPATYADDLATYR